MNNQMGLEILSLVIQTSYPNLVLSKNKDNSYAVDVKELHSLLLTGSHKMENDKFLMSSGEGMQQLIGGGMQQLFGGGMQQLIGGGMQQLFGGGMQEIIGGGKQLIGGGKQLIVGAMQISQNPILPILGFGGGMQHLIEGGKQLIGGGKQLIGGGMQLIGGGMLNPMLPMLGFGGGMQKLSEGGPSTSSITVPPDVLDERFHFDFTSITDKKSYYRGGLAYIRPCGWRRYALKVHGKYNDDIWLLGKSKRPDQYSSAEEEWPVSYHGTSYNNGLKIADEGYRLSKCERFQHGHGIYSTPDINVALLYSLGVKLSNGKTYRVVFQNRNNPKTLIKIDKSETGVGEYWISPNGKDIRPYGFCVQEC